MIQEINILKLSSKSGRNIWHFLVYSFIKNDLHVYQMRLRNCSFNFSIHYLMVFKHYMLFFTTLLETKLFITDTHCSDTLLVYVIQYLLFIKCSH